MADSFSPYVSKGFHIVPGALCAASFASSGGLLGNGTYSYKYTYVTAYGESLPSVASIAGNPGSTSGLASLTNILSGQVYVTSRNLYRTAANGGSYLFLASIADNTTTIYSDGADDGTLGAAAPTVSTADNGFLLYSSITAQNPYTNISPTNQIVLQPGGGSNKALILSAASPASANRIITFPDPGANVNILYDGGNQSFSGTINFTAASNQFEIQASGSGNKLIFTASNPATSDRTLTFPDPGAAANICENTIDNVFSSGQSITATTNQLTLGASSHKTIISSTAPSAASQTLTIPDSGNATANIVLDYGVYTFHGIQTFAAVVTFDSTTNFQNSSNQIEIQASGSGNAFIINGPNPASGNRVLALYDPVVNCNIALGINSVIQLVGNSGTQQVITSAQSGSILYIAQPTANVSILLPAPTTSGLYFRFIAQSTADGSHTATIASSAANILGSFIGTAAGLTPTVVTSAKTNVILSATAANVKNGDYMEFRSDGTNYWIYGYSAGSSVGWSTS